MLHYSVILISGLVACIVAVPLDNTQQSTKNSKNPSYQYEYTVGDSNGRGQGKVEMRSGELASGRYYINGDQSSTDVKYFADEWGYHPLVKYRASSVPSAINAHLALDNRRAQMLINNTEVEGIGIPAEPTQNSATEEVIPISQIENVNKELMPITNSPSKIEAFEFSNIPEFSHPKISNQNQLQTVIKSDNITNPMQYSETLVDVIGTNNQINGPSPTDLEDSLLNENAGSFGQRLSGTSDDPNLIQKLNNKNEDSVESSQNVFYVSTQSPEIIHKTTNNFKASNYNYKSALANFQSNLKLIQKSKSNTSQSDNAQEQLTFVPNTSILNNDDNGSIQSADELDKGSLKGISTGSNLAKFSRPIVVADDPDTDRFEYSTTLPCNEESLESIPLLNTAGQSILEDVTYSLTAIPEVQNQDHITISSAVLNPMQAGVALVNAGKTYLAEAEPSLTEAVNESGFDYSLDGSQALKQIGVAKTSTENSKAEINPVVGGDKLEKLTNVMPISVTDQGVEIQKSLEVYHSAPVHEIHYPAQITSQVTSIDQQAEAYLTTQKHENAKQVPFNDENLQSPTQIDLTNSNSNNFQYISIEDQPLMLLQEYQTIPGGNDPSYVSDVEQKVNVNNLTPENFKRLVQNYVAHRDTQGTKVAQENLTENENFYSKSRINGQIPSPELGKLSHAFVMGHSNRVNDKSINQNVEIVTGEVQSQTQSNLQRIPSKFSNIAQRLEADRLKYHAENQYHRQTNGNEFEIGWKYNYPESDINLTRQQNPIYTDELDAESSKIINNAIPVINVQSSLKSISNDKNSIYVPTPRTHNIDIKTNDYDASKFGINLMKTADMSSVQLLTHPMDKFVENVLVKASSSYPMHTQRVTENHVPVLQAYPVTVKKIIDKKVPYPIQMLPSQPYPFHILQPYPMEKILEKPIHIPLDKKVQSSVPYPLEIPLNIPYSTGLPTYIEKSVHMPYGYRYGVAYQQIMHPIHALYGRQNTNYIDQHNNNGNNINNLNINNHNGNNDNNHNSNNINNNADQISSSSIPIMAIRPSDPTNQYGSINLFSMSKQPISNRPAYPKKSYSSQLPFLTHSKYVDQPAAFRWHVMHPSNEKQKYKNVEYVRSVPLQQHDLNLHQQNQVPHPAHQEQLRYAEPVSSVRRVRKPEVQFYGKTGSFRQSKMEYGFKPPIIPSVQYDEETAMKVEN